MPGLNDMMEPNVCLLLLSAAVTLFLLIGALTDRTRSRPFMQCFIALLVCADLMLLGEAGLWFFGGSPEHIPLLKLCALLSFGCGAAVNALFAYCLVGFIRERANISYRFVHIIAAICGAFILLVVLSLYNGLLFSFDAGGRYVDGPWYGVVETVDLGTLLLEMLMLVGYRRILTTRRMLTLLSFCVLPLLSMLVLPYWNPTPMYVATTLSLILLLLLFHGELTRQLAEKEVQLAEGRIAIMLSQIQPHFLHNVLSSISQLCSENPRQAQLALDDFSIYLRGNMDSLSSAEPIYFPNELQHVQLYLKLEILRFQDKLRVVYDIQDDDFFLPPLVVQPLVENAVKHGIRPAGRPGTVTLRTWSEGDTIHIAVADDGVGFDPRERPADGRSHIGLTNIRDRLRQISDGVLTIESTPGRGTTATITLSRYGKEAAHEHLGG